MRNCGPLQPRYRPEIDWGHPIAKDLVFATVANEISRQKGSASVIREPRMCDLVTQSLANHAASPSPGWCTDVAGTAYWGLGNNNSYLSWPLLPMHLPGTRDCTLLFGLRPSSVTSTQSLFGTGVDSSSNRIAFNLCRKSTDWSLVNQVFTFNYEHYTATTLKRTAQSSACLTAGEYCQLAGCFRNSEGASRVYKNGVDVTAVQTNVGAAPNINTAGNIFLFAQQATVGVNGYQGLVFFAYLWMRALTPGELFWLAAEPYAFMLEQDARTYSIAGRASGSPWYQYAQM